MGSKVREGGRTFTDWLKVGGIRLLPADITKLTSVTSSAAELNILDGVTSTANDLNLVAGMAAATQRVKKVAKVALTALDTGGGVLSWQNPESASIIIDRVIYDITTKATGACTVDTGTTATSATTSSDNFMDGLDVGTAAGLFDNIGNPGTNGKARQKLAPGKWVTGSMASGAAAGIVGSAYIEYHLA